MSGYYFKNASGQNIFYNGQNPATASSYSAFSGDPKHTVFGKAAPTGFSHSGYGVVSPGSVQSPSGANAATPISPYTGQESEQQSALLAGLQNTLAPYTSQEAALQNSGLYGAYMDQSNRSFTHQVAGMVGGLNARGLGSSGMHDADAGQLNDQKWNSDTALSQQYGPLAQGELERQKELAGTNYLGQVTQLITNSGNALQGQQAANPSLPVTGAVGGALAPPKSWHPGMAGGYFHTGSGYGFVNRQGHTAAVGSVNPGKVTVYA